MGSRSATRRSDPAFRIIRRFAAVASGLALLVFATVGAADDARIVGYYSSWSIYARDYQVAEIPAAELTHVVYAFANISDTGECVLGDSVADVLNPYPNDGNLPVRGNFRQLQILKEQHPALRTLISVGGWTWSGRFSDVALTAASRQHFAASCVAFMRQYGFDGIDIDWEYPVGGGLPENVTRPEDKQNYTLLLAELRGQLDAQGIVDGRSYLLVIATSAAPANYANLELDQIPAFVDWIDVMAYDFYGSWSPITHLHALLFAPPDDPPWVSNDLSGDAALRAYQAAGVPAAKLVLGLPFYGHGWKGVPYIRNGLFQSHTGVPPGTYEDGVFDYRDLHDNYLGHFGRYWHAQAMAPWLYDPLTQIMISYEDPESIAAKTAYVDAGQLGGIMFWELSMDDAQHTLVDAVHTGLRATCPPTPRDGCDTPGKSALLIKDDGASKLSWTFSKGAVARVLADFGNPATSTTYTLCLYDAGARVGQAKVPFGAAWRASKSGYKYVARDGVTRVLLKSGAAGKTKAQVKGRGLSFPGLTPVSQPIDFTVQLISDANSVCWSDGYHAASNNRPGLVTARNK